MLLLKYACLCSACRWRVYIVMGTKSLADNWSNSNLFSIPFVPPILSVISISFSFGSASLSWLNFIPSNFFSFLSIMVSPVILGRVLRSCHCRRNDSGSPRSWRASAASSPFRTSNMFNWTGIAACVYSVTAAVHLDSLATAYTARFAFAISATSWRFLSLYLNVCMFAQHVTLGAIILIDHLLCVVKVKTAKEIFKSWVI